MYGIPMIEQLPIEKQYELLVGDIDRENAKQDNPLQLPTGFFQVLTRGGSKAGLGYYCPKCKLHVTNVAGPFKHCGQTTELPQPRKILGIAFIKTLPTYRLPY